MSDTGTPVPGATPITDGHARGPHPEPGATAWDSRAEALLSRPALGATGAPAGARPSGPTASGPIAAGPTASGPTASGPTAAGPTAAGLPVAGLPAGGYTAGGYTASGLPGPARRGSADPVKALLHRHRDLCERAVDPLEIAAGLEAHGVTDRTAARFRHRDVFSLAEELYARVPRGDDGDPPRPAAPAPGADAGRSGRAARAVVLALLPGALGGLTVAGLALTDGPARAAVGLIGVVALALAVTAGRPRGRRGTRACTGFLLLYALFGDGLLDELLTGGPDGPWPLDAPPLLGLALAAAPAVWCARLFAVRARRKLTASRGLADFAARTRPLLLGTVALYTAALTGLLVLVDTALGGTAPGDGSPGGGALALGSLLLLARLLTAHGFARAAAAGLLAACAAEAVALASVLAGRLPGCDLLGRPVEAAVAAGGPAVVPASACGAAALALLVYATAVLARASAHADDTTT
ncbi:hypothetical protein ACF068_01945 [Streptomyces sp. NPDC016309]|uniref:hypothetical protein n=1 Tax=Streptomyces sp. NPDC016309 TaxID=3364965 RepID=UPI0036F92AA8